MAPRSSLLDTAGRPLQQLFPINEIRTSKYTLLSFLPRNLFEQFRRFANIFFLTLAILQFYPMFQSINPWVASLPLMLVIAATSVKDALEDYRRHISDREINSTKVLRLARWTNTNAPFMQVPQTVTGLVDRFLKPFGLSSKRKSQRDKHSSLKNAQVHPDVSSSPDTPAFANVAGSLADPNRVTTSSATDANADWSEIEWRDIKVGDIIKLRDNDQIPADIIVLASSEPQGLCYVETKNLDGETNLKIRKSVDDHLAASTPAQLRALKCIVECEAAHPSIYSFTATLIDFSRQIGILPGMRALNFAASQKIDLDNSFDRISVAADSRRQSKLDVSNSFDYRAKKSTTDCEDDDAYVHVPVGISSMLLRGCQLRNTEWIHGMVVYTGRETKIRLNSGATPLKRSLIEDQTNFYIFLSLVTMVVFSIIVAVVDFTTEVRDRANKAPWLDFTFNSNTIGVAEGITNLVPISLYITVEIVKTLQSFLINEDLNMYDPISDENCVPRSWNLADDLGQIEYIFSDKTGTLTRNVMEFKQCSIHGVVYGSLDVSASIDVLSPVETILNVQDSATNTRAGAGAGAGAGIDIGSDPQHSRKPSNTPIAKAPFYDRKLAKHLKDRNSPHFRQAFEFFSCLSLCHTVLVSHNKHQDEHGNITSTLSYKAQSPDEAALVDAARDMGFVFKARDNTNVVVEMLGTSDTFTVLNVLEFSSSRKRMSVILRRSSGEIVLYCKGADTVIYERLVEGVDDMRAKTLEDLEMFAEEGLRTLCLASVVLSEAKYNEWAHLYKAASVALDHREERMEQVAELIERNLNLLGATAIEDKLQEGVPECIAMLQEAGIKIWVLTGDKMETAINIGYSCNLLTKDMTLLQIRGGNSMDDEGWTLKELQEAVASIDQIANKSSDGLNASMTRTYVHRTRPSIFKPNSQSPSCLMPQALLQIAETPEPKRRFALIIDGRALFHALGSDVKDTFVDLATRCAAVICCRVSPLQKAKVVQLMKSSQSAMCLAIGDGANDVSMIQAAHVGVGISGQEGLQAAMAADFVISQFRFLERLLLVQGRWCYNRTALMILNFFFKNFLYKILFNLVFTSLPVGVLGAFDQDVSAKTLKAFPPLYLSGVYRTIMTHQRVFRFVAEAFYQAGVITAVQLLSSQDTVIYLDGHTEDYTYVSIAMSISTLTIANFFVGFSINSWNWMMFAGIFLPNMIIFIFLFVSMELPVSSTLHYELSIYACPTFWFAYLLTVVLCFLPKFTIAAFTRMVIPSDTEIAQEHEMLQKKTQSSSVRQVNRAASPSQLPRPLHVTTAERVMTYHSSLDRTAKRGSISSPISALPPRPRSMAVVGIIEHRGRFHA
eukprot:jgi/Hompol1/6713/HPOL_005065-RA